MQVKLAEEAGFCQGVERALKIVLALTEKETGPIYTDGPLIHNPQVLDFLKNRGIKILGDRKAVPSGIIAIRTHGIGPERKKEIEATGAKIVDVTCPRVKKVQSLVKKHRDRGFAVVIVGDKNHPEVTSLLAFSSGKGMVISKKEEVEDLPETKKILVVAQTTENQQKFVDISQKIKKRFPAAVIFNTICNATLKRQKEVLSMTKKVDALVVVGGKMSGNTRRLAAISRSTGLPTFYLEKEDELELKKLAEFPIIGVTGGASTPLWLLKKVMKRIEAGEKECHNRAE